MFQSDEFDDFVDVKDVPMPCNPTVLTVTSSSTISTVSTISNSFDKSHNVSLEHSERPNIPKSPKRKKRKFPGPAGLLPENFKVYPNVENIIPSSQNFSQNQVSVTAFEDAPWCSMREDLKKYRNEQSRLEISQIKSERFWQNSGAKRVPLLAAVIQHIDRTLQTPSITLRDPTGDIQATLHRDAWEIFSGHMTPHCSVVLLQNVPILATGNLLKRIYLNITVNNIVAVYCDAESSFISRDGKTITENDKYVTEMVGSASNRIYILRNAMIEERLKSGKLSCRSGEKPKMEKINSEVEDYMCGITADSFLDDFD